jgi:alpha-ketoglutarate-dependent taurine dioxygenase
MRFELHENGWTTYVEDFDVNTCTEQDIKEICKMISKNTCVVIKNQPQISTERELEIINMFKDPSPLFHKKDEHFRHTAVDPDGLICRVTAEKNEEGKTGIGANPGDFDWHANVTWRRIREPIIWLRAVKGTKGSTTSYNNNVMTWNDLPATFQKTLKDLKLVITGGRRHDGSPISAREDEDRGEKFNHPLVYTSPLTGRVGLYCPYLQIRGIVDMPQDEAADLIKWLGEYTTQEKYIYHHNWDDGDIVVADQWHGIHKRWKFVNLETRVLHRAALYYPEQDYSI